MEAHRQLGHGFLESVYHEAMAIELAERGVPFLREAELPIRYKSVLLATKFRVDFPCFDEIVVELKAVSALSGIETAQVLNYLLNFGAPSLVHQRLIAHDSWRTRDS